MPNNPQAAIAAMLVLAIGQAIAIRAAEPNDAFYVAVQGHDADPGTEDKPFASLERARDAVREMKKAGPLTASVTVWLRAGTYQRTKTFELKQEDSGAATTPIVYRACDNEDVHLVGGRPLEAAWFKPVDDAALVERLDEEARGKLLQADLRAHGISDFSELHGMGGGLKLFLGDQRLPLARWPNTGWALGRRGRATGKDKDGTPQVQDEGNECKTLTFHFSGKRPNQWHDLTDVYVCNFFWEEYCFHAWQAERVDPKRQEITFGHALIDRLKDWLRFCVVNALEEIDQPGEWYLDRKRGILYLLPPAGFGSQPLLASMLQDTMISLDQASFVTIHGLTLEAMRGLPIMIGGGSNNLIARCAIRNAARGAEFVGGTNNGIAGCEVYNLEASGLRLVGGDRKTLTPAGRYAVSNHVHHYGQCIKEWQPGVQFQGVGHRVAHCKIHHAPAYAISFEGNDHLFEFNEIHDVDLEMSDVGVIGTGTDWTFRGNVIRHNFIHHIPARPYPGVVAIYLDNRQAVHDHQRQPRDRRRSRLRRSGKRGLPIAGRFRRLSQDPQFQEDPVRPDGPVAERVGHFNCVRPAVPRCAAA